MFRILAIAVLLAVGLPLFAQNSLNQDLPESDSLRARAIYDDALTQSEVYSNLSELCTDIGGRLSGSEGAEKAGDWAYDKLVAMGADSVWKQPVMVPHWVRGDVEKASVHVDGKSKEIPVTALGGSVGTEGVIRAGVVEVFRFEDLERLGREQIEGKIVLYNRPMQPRLINTFEAYSGCVDQRGSGASEAAPYGAVAVLVRSMNLRMDDLPHTGVQRYKEGVNQIPAAAVSTNAAAELSRALRENPDLEVSLELSCENLPDALSYNVIAEIKGSEYPDEIILVGGHLDSWDLGQGAHDDGAGSVQSMEVINSFIRMGIRPKRSIRCVLFMNEENGARGAVKYAEEAARLKENHIVAIESDRGGFSPRGFTVDGLEDISGPALKQLKSWASVFAPYGIHSLTPGFAGVDINYLKDQGVILMGLVPDSQRYFDFHHAKNDRIEGVNKRELELGSASLVTLIDLIDRYGPVSDQLPERKY